MQKKSVKNEAVNQDDSTAMRRERRREYSAPTVRVSRACAVVGGGFSPPTEGPAFDPDQQP